MKRKILLVSILAAVLLIATAFWAGTAFATTGCFSDTNGHWAETYICWLKDNFISTGYLDGTYRPENFITRGEMAVMLKRQADVPPSAGLIMITPGNGEWLERTAANDVTFNNLGYSTSAIKATVGDAWITLQPSIPTVLYGKRLQLVGIDFCYQASTEAVLWSLDMATFGSTTGAPGAYTGRIADDTDRTDTACRWYPLATPYTLYKYEGVVFYVHVNWTVAAAEFKITRTTFVFQATDQPATIFP